jgi:hypothetical protein
VGARRAREWATKPRRSTKQRGTKAHVAMARALLSRRSFDKGVPLMKSFVHPSLAAALLFSTAACSGPAQTSENDTPHGSNPPKGGSDASISDAGPPSSSSGGDGGGATGPTNGSGDTDGGPELFLWRDRIFTGTDGTHEYVVPSAAFLVVPGTSDTNPDKPIPFTTPPTLTVADPSIATVKIVPVPSGGDIAKDDFFKGAAFMLITAKAAGQTTLTVSYGGQTVKAGLQVNAYTAAQYTLGQTRYTTPANPGPMRKACTTCHAQDSDAGLKAPKHDPFLQQDLSDSDLLTIIEKGQYVENDPNSTLNVPGGHTWNMTADEEKAIVAYLRSLRTVGF